ncbi:hypothetical protein GCM10010377_44330 [Streptomyces viridiviolaceus]|uniref:hypothetical protein n=1 Tax=Streptomyces viridiviolaceus TaxID=68282 RepID=UPI001673F11F|nr:hypothetical protein [Streptomyces viridiviolaceus]GHB48537.1 hypothetical protein GCM10010377_44330 [Streptomyces viridiviolaceus]
MSVEVREERTAWPRISYFTFFLRGLEDGADPQSASSGVSARRRWTVLAGPGGAVFKCGTTDHCPEVRIQYWSGEPPALDGQWDTVDSVRFELHTEGRVQLNESDGFPAGDVLDLGGPGTYRLRAASRGRARAQQRHAAGELFFRGTEEWLLQLWSG